MKQRITAVLFLVTYLTSATQTLQAYQWSLGNIDVNLKGEVDYACRVRTEHPHMYIKDIFMGSPDAPMASVFYMADSGDWNFNKGNLVNNKIGTIWELDASTPHLAFFLRNEIFVDFEYLDKDKFSEETREHAGFNYTDALEFYLEGSRGGFTSRVGRQIVQWGDSIAPVFAPTVNVVNAMSAQKATTAGYTTRDYYVPSYMLWAAYELYGNMPFEWMNKGVKRLNKWVNLSFEGVYAPYFEPRDGLPVTGTFMSPVDLIGYGALDIALEFMVIDDLRPLDFEDMQQYGGAVRMIFPGLANLETGFYYYHYLDRMPSMELVHFSLSPEKSARAELSYPEIDMYGFSLSHAIQTFGLNLQLGGEVAYRPNAPLAKHYYFEGVLMPWGLGTQYIGALGGYDRGKTLNWSLSGMRMWFDVLPFTPWTVQLIGLFEFYGGWNLDYVEDRYASPENTYFYQVTPTFNCSDMIDNTTISFGVTAMGVLHQSQRSLHHFIYNLKAKVGDAWEVTLGYDHMIGDVQEEMWEYPASIFMDRDAFTFKLAYYFM